MAVQNRAWVYAKTPEDPYRGATSIYELREVEMPEVKEGEMLLRLATISIAPHVRAFLELPGNDVGAEELGLQRLKLGEVVGVEAIAEVAESKSKKYKVGDRVWVPDTKLVEYFTRRDDGKDTKEGMAPFKVPGFVKSETMLSTCTPAGGITAYCAINDHECGRVDEPGLMGCLMGCFPLKPKKRKTVLVTSAAGGVGIVACQLYKSKGCKVIGVTSTREKADKLLEHGCDHAIAYRTESMDERLSELAPEGLDVFFDNVGAAQLDDGSKHMKIGGRIIQVGCQAEIDHYCTGKLSGWKEYHRMAAREMKVGGFLMLNHLKKIPVALASLALMIRSGKVKPAATVVTAGIEGWAGCVDQIHEGDTFGRLLLSVPVPNGAEKGA